MEKKGGILLTEKGQNILKLKTSFNLSEKIQTMCAQVPFGHCICGKAAATRQIQFADCLDERHENSYEGIKPHGHYNVPILTSDKVLGVIVVYLTEYHKQDKFEKDFLLAVAVILSGLIQRKHGEEELIKAKEKAEESDNLKTEFLAHMSHEIRTPINIILGNTDYLNESIGKNMDSDTRDCFDSIDVASKRIIRTVDLILNTAELQTCGYKSNLHKIDLDFEILNKLFKENQLSAKQKGLEFTYSSSEKDCFVIADEYSITQIFTNLIDNAIKFTKKGKVEILLGKNITGNIIVEIKDTGIGMNKEFLPKLYEPFIQEEQGYSRSYDGNGLGLSLVKKYCEINNAIIEVESEKNVGTTFRVIFKD